MNKKIILIFSLIFLVSLENITALELNPLANKKIYEPTLKEDLSDFLKKDFNEKYGVIRISETFFWFESDKIAEYSLIENTEQCLVNCEARGKATLYKDGKLFDDFEFKNKLGELKNIEYKTYLKDYKIYNEQIPQYELKCEDIISKNGTITKDCTNEVVGYTTEKKINEIWKEYNGEILPAGNYEWKITGKKKPMESIDWVGISNEIKLDNWAWWDGNWKRKIEITLDYQNSEFDRQNIVFKIYINYKDGMKSDFSDLRFIDSAETEEFPYYLVNNESEKGVIAYVKLSSLAANSNSINISLYYDNPEATSTANPNTTFELFEDCNNPLSTSKWNFADITVENGTCITNKIYPGSGWISYMRSVKKFYSPDYFIAEFLLNDGFYDEGLDYGNYGFTDNNDNGFITQQYYDYGNSTFVKFINASEKWTNLNFSYGKIFADFLMVYNSTYNFLNITSANGIFSYGGNLNGVYDKNLSFSIATNGQPRIELDELRIFKSIPINNISFSNESTLFYTQEISNYYAVEGSNINVTLILNFTKELINSNALLNYNNQFYTPTYVYNVSNSTIFIKSLYIPIGTGNSTGKNVSWYWIFNVSESSYRTSNKSQIILSPAPYTCGEGEKILYLSLLDEESKEIINASELNPILEINFNITLLSTPFYSWGYYNTFNNSYAEICIPNNILNDTSFRIDVLGSYTADGKVKRFFYLDNGTLSNSQYLNSITTKNLTFYTLDLEDSTTFLVELYDENYLPYTDAIIHAYRKEIGEGKDNEVERGKTDESGQTHLHLIEEDVIYYFIISKDGEIVYTTNEYNAKCLTSPCKITLFLTPTNINWTIIDINENKYYVETNQNNRIISLNYQLAKPSLINASVYSYDDGKVKLINTSSEYGITGEINLYTPLTYGNKTFFLAIYNDNSFVKSVWIDLTERGYNYFGSAGAILGAFLILGLALMGVTEGVILIVITLISLILIAGLKLVDMGWFSIAGLIAVGGILIWKLVNRGAKQ